MDGTNGLKETTRVTAPVASNTLSVNVFTAPGKTMVGERPKPFGEPFGFDPITSTLIFGEYDAVLVDAMGTVAEAEALAEWVAPHNRNLDTIYITHAHFDHFYGLSILLDRFPGIAHRPEVNAADEEQAPAWPGFRHRCKSSATSFSPLRFSCRRPFPMTAPHRRALPHFTSGSAVRAALPLDAARGGARGGFSLGSGRHFRPSRASTAKFDLAALPYWLTIRLARAASRVARKQTAPGRSARFLRSPGARPRRPLRGSLST